MKARMFTDENRKWWTLVAVSFGLFMIMLDNTVVNVALPSIRSDLGISVSELEWVVNAYALTFGVLLLTGGKLADLLGRRAIFIAGPGGLHRRLALVRARRRRGVADRRPHRPGRRRGADEPGDPLDHHRNFPAAAARHRDRDLGRGLRAGPGDRPAGRRCDHRADQLELDLLRQRAGGDRRRAGGASVHRRVEGHVARAAARPSRSGQLRRRALRPHLRADRDEHPSMGLDAGDRPARPRRGGAHGVRAARGASAPPDARPALCFATRPSAGRTR